MPTLLARWISILWHPVLSIAVSALWATLLAGGVARGHSVLLWVGGVLAIVLGFLVWQTRRGGWSHVDASQPKERRSLNRFLLIGLGIAAAATAQSGAAELASVLGVVTASMAVVMLSARWLKISQHCLFAVLPMAWLWPSALASAVFAVMALLVAVSRLRLRRHTAAEVVCGLLLGAVAALGLALISPTPTAFKPSWVSCGAAEARDDGWRVAPLPAAVEQRLCEALDAQVEGGANLHAFLVEQGGRIRFEAYARGVDRSVGALLPELRRFGPDSPHDLRSISKSVLGLLVVLAEADGTLDSMQRPVLDFFPEYADLRAGPLQALRLEHLLDMSAGLAWNESGSYASLSNSETRMRLADDPLRYVLTRELRFEPGRQFAHSGGNTAVLAEVLERVSGRPLADYAQTALFTPLGIDSAEWVRDRRGKALAYSGLRLSARDLARVGRLLLAGGRWQERTLLPAAATATLLTPRIDTGDGLRYGRQWWHAAAGVEPAWIAAFGNGGQRLYLLPSLDMSIVILAGDYNRPGQAQAGRALLNAVIEEAGLAVETH
ncbi:MAG: serine hydrolase [Lysobacterales bacterium]|jgi:CubicO group peptidase (beta-lactamase class C family)